MSTNATDSRRRADEPARPTHILRTLGASMREYKKASWLAPAFVAVVTTWALLPGRMQISPG